MAYPRSRYALPGGLAVVPIPPPPRYVLALAWRAGERAAARRFLAYLRCYRDRHQRITGLQAAMARRRAGNPDPRPAGR
jgi:hypothetical protein